MKHMPSFSPSVTSETTVLAVIGDPIRHSKSPLMHNAALAACGWNGIYTAFHVKQEQLGEAIAGMRALGIRGMNVTIPHKEQVIDFLDEVDDHARIIGAVNTIVNENGKLIGYNTDGPGYVRSLKEETGVQLSTANVLLLGAGGAARGLAYSLLREGVQQLMIANRTLERAERIAKELSEYGSVEAVELKDGVPLIGNREVHIIIHTTSLGMHPNVDDIALNPTCIKPGMIVSDIVYNPLETRLLAEARARGAIVHSGLGMFVYQGAIAFELWTGMTPPISMMRDAVLKTIE